MPADAPTILATSGGTRPGTYTNFEMNKLVHHAVELSGARGRPKVCFIGTATGDDLRYQYDMLDAGRVAGFEMTSLCLFTKPNVPDVAAHVFSQDVVWVGGGSVANLLAVWAVHGLDAIMRQAWEAGVVLAGVSAGSICWHDGGTTDSWGMPVRPLTNGLGFLPYGNGVHYDSEESRRPTMHRLVADGTFPLAYCTDDGVGLHYRGTELVEAVTERPGAYGYVVRREDGQAVEEQLPTRVL